MILDKETRRPRGMCIVKMTTSIDCQQAINVLNEAKVKGRVIHIRFNEDSKQGNKNQSQSHNHERGYPAPVQQLYPAPTQTQQQYPAPVSNSSRPNFNDRQEQYTRNDYQRQDNPTRRPNNDQGNQAYNNKRNWQVKMMIIGQTKGNQGNRNLNKNVFKSWLVYLV